MRASLVPLMDESELASTGFTDASTLSGSTSNNRESGRPCSSPTCLIRRYQKNSAVCVRVVSCGAVVC